MSAAVPTPMGDYSLAREADGLLFLAGMTPRDASGALVPGIVGADLSLDGARAAARLATERALAAASEHPRFDRAVSMTVFVRCTSAFTELSAVGDGASGAIAVWAPGAPPPARAVVGVASLPGGAPVEVQLVLGAAA